MFGGKIFFVSLVSLNRISSHIFSGLLSFSFSLHQHQNFIKLFRTVLLVCGFASVVSALLLRTLSFPTNQSQDSRFMTCFTFQNMFSFLFFSFPKKVKQSLCLKNNVACRHRWHAKPFSVVY